MSVFTKRTLGSLLGVCFFMAPTLSWADGENWVGARSDDSYQYTWQNTVPGVDAICGGFASKMNTYADSQKKFWAGLGDGSAYEEGTDDGTYGADTVDLFMSCTHGGVASNPDYFIIAMWYQNDFVYSNDMRLGDDDRGLSVFSAYSCSLMNVTSTTSTNMWNRWHPVFSGGLRAATGFATEAYAWSNDAGTNYAEELHVSGRAIARAWVYTMDDYYLHKPTAVYTQKSYSTDPMLYGCGARLNYMTLANYTTYPKLADNDISTFCYYTISE